MCKALEDMRNEAEYYKAIEIVKQMIARIYHKYVSIAEPILNQS